MIQALLHNKLKDSFTNPHFTPSEDSLTSSVIGLMQYLPSKLFWQFLRSSCGGKEKLPSDIGQIISFSFWERLLPDGKYNSSHVEPDVLVETEEFYIIIEAKKYDSANQQDETQWEKEIVALQKTYDDSEKNIIFIALGGNVYLQDLELTVNDKAYTIHRSSWYNLLLQISNALHEGNLENREQVRLLTDIVTILAKHGYLSTRWLEELSCKNLNGESSDKIVSLWEFDNKSFWKDLGQILKGINTHKQLEIWNLK